MIKIPCEIYSRVVGYFRPTSQFNPGKQEEFKNRLPFKIELDYEILEKKFLDKKLNK